jgi:hypothetical protein
MISYSDPRSSLGREVGDSLMSFASSKRKQRRNVKRLLDEPRRRAREVMGAYPLPRYRLAAPSRMMANHCIAESRPARTPSRD